MHSCRSIRFAADISGDTVPECEGAKIVEAH